jgi:hypothetical protein
MLGQEDGFDAITVLDSFHLVLVIFSPSLKVRGYEDDYESLMCGLLGNIFACPCGPRFKAMFTLRGRLRDPLSRLFPIFSLFWHLPNPRSHAEAGFFVENQQS